jgi:alpha-beta hydrolase superfamily lysophospholipase
VGENTKSVISLIKLYEKIGIKEVSYKFYAEGRHEMLNEINRDEVMKDTLKWLDVHI